MVNLQTRESHTDAAGGGNFPAIFINVPECDHKKGHLAVDPTCIENHFTSGALRSAADGKENDCNLVNKTRNKIQNSLWDNCLVVKASCL